MAKSRTNMPELKGMSVFRPTDIYTIANALVKEVTGQTATIQAINTASWNRQQKGSAPHSKHLYGLAADIWVGHYDKNRQPVRTKTPAEVAAIAEIFLGNSGGVGIYKTFTHVDVRTGSSRWKG